MTVEKIFIAAKKKKRAGSLHCHELYDLSSDDWKHLTSTFTFGNGESKAELDEIIRQSLALWAR